MVIEEIDDLREEEAGRNLSVIRERSPELAAGLESGDEPPVIREAGDDLALDVNLGHQFASEVW